jgi:hypothetical protein
MFEKLNNSWELVKASARVLQQDKELLIFPIISTIGLVIVSAVFLLPMIFGNLLDSFFNSQTMVFGYVVLFLFYIVQYVVIFFANTALVGAAQIRLRGGDPTVSDGFRIAMGHLPAIFGYALISATVGVILKALARKGNTFGRIIISLIGFAWNVSTFLVVPILVTENVGPIEAIKRSVALLKRTWGEQVIGNFGLGAFFNLVYFGLVILGAGLFVTAAVVVQSLVVAIVVAVLFIILLALVGLINSALSGIYTAAVYEYAANGQSNGAFFEASMVKNAFVTRG